VFFLKKRTVQAENTECKRQNAKVRSQTCALRALTPRQP
jgi:hypothetical protein